LRAVLHTELLQTFVLLGGSIAVTLAGVSAAGGWGAMQSAVGAGFFDMWQPASHPDFPWTGILFGAPILGVWYWCTDQFIVQRVLAARGIDAARRGTIFAGYLKLLPLFIFVLPGIAAAALVKSGDLQLARADHAFPEMVRQLLPVGVRGIVLAGFLAALMSSLAAVFNSCSTLITWDVYRKLHPGASEQRLVWVGKVSTVVLVALGLAWIPFMELISSRLYVYLQSVQAYISPPIAAVFLLGITWRRVNARGAIAALATGFVLGIGRLVLELNKGSLDGALLWYASINFLHFAILLFVACTVMLVVVSLATAAPSDAKLAGLTFATAGAGRAEAAAATSEAGWRRRDLWLSLALVLCVALVWLAFTG
jgi:SSS family solute:Na+ symporter